MDQERRIELYVTLLLVLPSAQTSETNTYTGHLVLRLRIVSMVSLQAIQGVGRHRIFHLRVPLSRLPLQEDIADALSRARSNNLLRVGEGGIRPRWGVVPRRRRAKAIRDEARYHSCRADE